MSRIDEALRLSGEDAPARVADDRQAPFVSPWAIAPASRPAPVEPERLPPRDTALVSVLTSATRSPVGFGGQWRERLATAPGANSILVEQFRRLAGTLHRAQSSTGIKVVMITSASPEDGKTMTAVNLSLVLSESYRRRVLLIDADLRRPSLGNLAEVTDRSGLTGALKAPVDHKVAVLPVTPLLTLLPAGQPDPDPMGGLTSPRMRAILDDAAGRFDWVILDAPPMGPIADASLLMQMVEGAIFVVRAAKTQHGAVEKAIASLGRDRVLGVVLNALEQMPAEQNYYYAQGAE